MASGTIASLRDRGFGFIMPDGSTSRGDLFFHRSAVVERSFDQLREGQRVSFDEEPDPRDASRRRAVNVRVIADDAAEEQEQEHQAEAEAEAEAEASTT